MKIYIKRFGLCFILEALFPSQAYAYIDPGSGALLLQMLIAGFIGAMFYLRNYLSKIKAFVFRKRKSKQLNEE